MALVNYLDWEVRTTGHDLNCSGFNPNRDPTNGVDYTQQDNAEITSLNWVVDNTNNTWIRSTELTNWVNSGKTLASLKGNHIHIAGKAIGGNTLFQWNASTAVPGAYYLQALGGGNPNWTTKPTIFWMNKTFVLENTSLPAGANSWTYGDKDSLGYSTIYVRFGAESDANPNSKAQDDIIADGQTWTRGAYEITNVGTDGNGPYLVLDRSPGAAGSTAGYGRIGGAVSSIRIVRALGGSSQIAWVRPGTYTLHRYRFDSLLVKGYDGVKNKRPSTLPIFIPEYHDYDYCGLVLFFIKLYSPTSKLMQRRVYLYYCECENVGIHNGHAYACYMKNSGIGYSTYDFCFIDGYYQEWGSFFSKFTIFKNPSSMGGWYGYGLENCIVYGCQSHGWSATRQSTSATILRNNIFVNCSGYAVYKTVNDNVQIFQNNYYYACANGGTNRPSEVEVILLPGNPFRDPDNGDFRLADNEAGRMLKQAGFQIPGPQGAPPMKFDVGAVQNSFYDIASGGAFVLPPRIIGA